MKNGKIWLKEHKKELIVGVVAVAGTVFIMRTKKIYAKGNLTLGVNFLDGADDDSPYFGRGDNYTNINMIKPNLKVSDLGKLGETLLEKIPDLTKDSAIDYLNCSYNQYNRER